MEPKPGEASRDGDPVPLATAFEDLLSVVRACEREWEMLNRVDADLRRRGE